MKWEISALFQNFANFTNFFFGEPELPIIPLTRMDWISLFIPSCARPVFIPSRALDLEPPIWEGRSAARSESPRPPCRGSGRRRLAGAPPARRGAAGELRLPAAVRRRYAAPRPPVAAGGPRPPPSRPPRSHFPCFRKALNDSFYRSILLLVDRWPQNSINLLLPSIGDQNPLHHNL